MQKSKVVLVEALGKQKYREYLKTTVREKSKELADARRVSKIQYSVSSTKISQENHDLQTSHKEIETMLTTRLDNLEETWKQKVQQLTTDFELERRRIRDEEAVKSSKIREQITAEHERRLAEQRAEYEVRLFLFSSLFLLC